MLHWRYGRYLSFLGMTLYVARRRAAARLAFARWLFQTGRMSEFDVRESEDTSGDTTDLPTHDR